MKLLVRMRSSQARTLEPSSKRSQAHMARIRVSWTRSRASACDRVRRSAVPYISDWQGMQAAENARWLRVAAALAAGVGSARRIDWRGARVGRRTRRDEAGATAGEAATAVESEVRMPGPRATAMPARRRWKCLDLRG